MPNYEHASLNRVEGVRGCTASVAPPTSVPRSAPSLVGLWGPLGDTGLAGDYYSDNFKHPHLPAPSVLTATNTSMTMKASRPEHLAPE